jgi:putative N6-adenine-specific DNA methylase
VLRANLWLRTASRVIVRVAAFRARSFIELERHARRIEWERFVSAQTPLRFRVTSRKSKLYHTEAIAQRLAEAVAHRVGDSASISVERDDDEAIEQGEAAEAAQAVDGQLFVVRALRDEITVSADASGELLHRRGYRQAVAKAPLRETLAAAMLLGAGWRGDTPLIDPMCGSGTIPIEGALMARRMAPGLGRTVAALRWPGTELAVWTRLVAMAKETMLERSPVSIRGSDRDAGAIAAARANAERAGVAADIAFEVAPFSGVEPIGDASGLLLVNPPYGVRIGEVESLRDLYAMLGRLARERFARWTFGVLAAEPRLEAQLGRGLEERFASSNGGIPVKLLVRNATPSVLVPGSC